MRRYWDDDLRDLPWAVLVTVCAVTAAHLAAGTVLWP